MRASTVARSYGRRADAEDASQSERDCSAKQGVRASKINAGTGMLPVRLRFVGMVMAVLVCAVCLPPSRADAAVPRHRTPHPRSCERLTVRCLAWTRHERFRPLHHTRNPHSDDVLDDFDDRDLGGDREPTASAADHTEVPDTDCAPPWVCVRRAANPRVDRLIVWRTLAAPRPPPSL